MKSLTFTLMAFVAFTTFQAFANTSDTSATMNNRLGYKGENPESSAYAAPYRSDIAKTNTYTNKDLKRTDLTRTNGMDRNTLTDTADAYQMNR